jgi:serine/tyrosine/threonine adenylyltransferase
MPIPFENTYAKLPPAFHERVAPTPVANPQRIALNRPLADCLGLDVGYLESDEGLAFLAGNVIPPGAEPLAMAYAGHQFGGFSPQLGDGRAILIGEVIDHDGIRRDLQWKGSGPTPFSRRGDGRSALGPVLREYLVSEAMAALGVPTTRALSAVSSGQPVYREEIEPGGVFVRVSASHLRIGTFQYFAARQDHSSLRTLLDYAIHRHYPACAEAENPALAFLAQVCQTQAQLVARWMQIGFIHGVMNTDNTSISGETIDYGPCAFMDDYNPDQKYSYIDQGGRYAYNQQPNIALWNLTRLAEALLSVIDPNPALAAPAAEDVLNKYPEAFQDALVAGFSQKIGLPSNESAHWPLVQKLLEIMEENRADFTLTFRHLSGAIQPGSEASLLSLFPRPAALLDWLSEWRERLHQCDSSLDQVATGMKLHNPAFIPRNHRIEEVIVAAKSGDFAHFHRLHGVLAYPYDEQTAFREYAEPPADNEIVRATFCGT